MNEMQGIEFEDEMYHCEKCKVVFTTTEDNPVCPTCKKDDQLTLIDEENLKDNYMQGPLQPLVDEIDRQTALNSAQSMEQPDQKGYLQCLECGNTFLMLASDECCPYCSTLLPDTVAADDEMEWSCPYCYESFSESDMTIVGQCPHCNGPVELTPPTNESEAMECPRCHMMWAEKELAGGKCPDCGEPFAIQTAESENQMESDSGAFLDQTDKEHQSILDAAAEADKTLERIPDPEKPGQPKPLGASLMDKMKKVFGGGNDTVH